MTNFVRVAQHTKHKHMSKESINASVGEITINGTVYVPKGSENKSDKLASLKGLPVVIVRSVGAGVHYGTLKDTMNSKATVVLGNSRRLWSWKGANCLSDIAKTGVSNPDECRFSVRSEEITIVGVCEIIPVTDAAKDCIEAVKEWR